MGRRGRILDALMCRRAVLVSSCFPPRRRASSPRRTRLGVDDLRSPDASPRAMTFVDDAVHVRCARRRRSIHERRRLMSGVQDSRYARQRGSTYQLCRSIAQRRRRHEPRSRRHRDPPCRRPRSHPQKHRSIPVPPACPKPSITIGFEPPAFCDCPLSVATGAVTRASRQPPSAATHRCRQPRPAVNSPPQHRRPQPSYHAWAS